MRKNRQAQSSRARHKPRCVLFSGMTRAMFSGKDLLLCVWILLVMWRNRLFLIWMDAWRRAIASRAACGSADLRAAGSALGSLKRLAAWPPPSALALEQLVHVPRAHDVRKGSAASGSRRDGRRRLHRKARADAERHATDRVGAHSLNAERRRGSGWPLQIAVLSVCVALRGCAAARDRNRRGRNRYGWRRDGPVIGLEPRGWRQRYGRRRHAVALRHGRRRHLARRRRRRWWRARCRGRGGRR